MRCCGALRSRSRYARHQSRTEGNRNMAVHSLTVLAHGEQADLSLTPNAS